MEERPKRRAVQKEISPTIDVQRETHSTGLIAASAPGEIRVTVQAISRPRSRGVLLRADTLPVGRFGLLHAGVDVFRVVEVVVVEGVVFESGACEPGCLCGFDEQTAARGDVLMAAALERMVGGPAPHVLYVGR